LETGEVSRITIFDEPVMLRPRCVAVRSEPQRRWRGTSRPWVLRLLRPWVLCLAVAAVILVLMMV
jgi:hypothetical protein